MFLDQLHLLWRLSHPNVAHKCMVFVLRQDGYNISWFAVLRLGNGIPMELRFPALIDTTEGVQNLHHQNIANGDIKALDLFGKKLTINSSSRSPNRAATSMFIAPKSLSDSISEGLIFKGVCPQTPRWHTLHANVLRTLRYQLYRSLKFLICCGHPKSFWRP